MTIPTKSESHLTNFIRNIIDEDLSQQKWSARQKLVGSSHLIQTRFPPEPNGYLHIGHAKSICLNFGLARDYNGICHLRFDDTNPEKESLEYVESIMDAVHWLGFQWGTHLYYASDYFEKLYQFAEWFIQQGKAYVDSQSADDMRGTRGTLTEAGQDSPYRSRSVEESLRLFREMRAGKHADGAHVLRLKIDMASPNMNLRDPVIYRIRRAHHHRTGDKWCIYPMYDYTHCISDALEHITHSVCTLEFEDHRPLYDWVLNQLADGGFFHRPLPQQIEFARLNLTYVVTSKRKLQQLVQEALVDGWDDPRMPTLVGLRRRGYTPASIQLFCERIGVSKADSWIDYSVLEQALRDDLDPIAPRAVAVLNPLKLIIDNYPAGQSEPCHAPVHPHHPEQGQRTFSFSNTLWIEAEDFCEEPPKGYFRLFPGNKVRLRYGYVIECTGCAKDVHGNIIAVHANYIPDTKSGTPGADSVKVKGNIHWLSAAHALKAKVRLYDRLFLDPQPDSGGKDFKTCLNPDSVKIVQAWLEPTLERSRREERFQFERHGYFVSDRTDSKREALVFNRVATLKDTWK
ncbi:MAG: glutamine--tRNA ligase/YqeY domain fusion protein [Burkholderiaceae bacterium]|nr:MAG: glutamine--tRNA ligase/YqeY domain fusion protein [Burkholderiaceae bacterium]